MEQQLNLEVRDSVYDPALPPSAARKIAYSPRGQNKTSYKVWLYLAGNDLPFVRRVTYRLHPTFPNPVINVSRSIQNPSCQLIIWTWGVFVVNVTVETKTGARFNLQHTLSYDREITQAPPESFVQETPSANGPNWTAL
jgi:hypothetical protein